MFPYKAYGGDFEGRKDWVPTNFTDPSKHTNTSYKYIVHTLMQAPSKVTEYELGTTTELENFNKLRQKYLPFSKVPTANEKTEDQRKSFVQLHTGFMAQYLSDHSIIRQNIISATVISEAKHAGAAGVYLQHVAVGFEHRQPDERHHRRT